MPKSSRHILVFGACLVFLACGDGDDDFNGSIGGSYAGTVAQDNGVASGDLEFTVVETGSEISGTFTDSGGTSGTLSGSRTGNALQLTATPLFLTGSPGQCAAAITARVDSGPTISGTYTRTSCQTPTARTPLTGTLQASRIEEP